MAIDFNPASKAPQTYTASTVSSSSSQPKEKAAYPSRDQLILSSRGKAELSDDVSVEGAPALSEKSADASALSETTFPEFNPVKKLAEYINILKDHYDKVNEENKRFPNPEQHIWRKYNDRTYPYYVKNLTNMERQICYEQEIDVYNGELPTPDGYDPVLQERFGGNNALKRDLDYNMETRRQITSIINQTFEKLGIVIPDGSEFSLSVDPYDYKIHVYGLDEELAEQIENALNTGENGFNLYSHILYCNPAQLGAPEPPQYSGMDFKGMIYRIVKDFTGYDIRELENKDGKFLTPDGRDVWDVVKEKYNEMCEQDGVSSLPGFSINDTHAIYRTIAKVGWDNQPDKNMSLIYKDGFLYDPDTEYGYGPGQTEWIDEVNRQYWEQHEAYQAKRQEIIRYEETQPNALDRFRADATHFIGNPAGKSLYDVGLITINGKFISLHPFDDEVLARLTLSFKMPEMALSKSILSIPPVTTVRRKSLDLLT